MKVPLFFLLLFSGTIASAQLDQPNRFELVSKPSDAEFTILSMKDEGLLLVRDKEKYEGGKKMWEVVLLDTDLKEKKKLELRVEQRQRLIGYEYIKGSLTLLFRAGESNKSDIELHEINTTTFDQRSFTIEPELNLSLTHFIRVGNTAILAGYVNRDPTVLLYNLPDKKSIFLPGFFQKDAELVELRSNSNGTFNVVLIVKASRDEYTLSFRTFDEAGNLLLQDDVNLNSRTTLQTGVTSELQREDMMLAGSWGENNSKQSNGLYLLPIDPFNDQKIQYVAFGELNRFLDYMKPSRAERIKEKSKEEVKNGGIPNFVSYVMPYRIAENEKGFVLLAEVYTPTQSGSAYSGPYNPYYGPYYYPYGFYPGYGRFYSSPYSYNGPKNITETRTVSSSVVAVSPKGKVLWDYSFALDEYKQPHLEQVSDFYCDDSQLLIIYKEESELKYKRVVLDSEEETTETLKVRTLEPQDEIRSERENDGGIRFWYGNSFYVWGYQTIRNLSLEDRTRDVFYINKLTVR